jgi:hypothetical protein
LVVTLLACSISVPSFESVTGSGEVVTITSDAADFNRIVIGHAFDATVRQGDSYSVVIRIDDDLESRLQATQQGRTLYIGLEPEPGLGVMDATLEVDITMPAVEGIEVGGASHVSLAGFEARDDLSLEASGGSSIDGEILAGDAVIEASGASHVSLVGECGVLTLEVSGSSSVELGEFPASDVHASLSGASSATVNTDGTLDVDASGASHLNYLGAPTLGQVDLSGASTIEEE